MNEIKYTKRGPYIPPVLDQDYSALDPDLKAAMDDRLATDELLRQYKLKRRLTDDEFDDDMFSWENGDGQIY